MTNESPQSYYIQNGQKYSYNNNNTKVYTVQNSENPPKVIRKSLIQNESPGIKSEQEIESSTNITLNLGGPQGDQVTINSNQIHPSQQQRYSQTKQAPQTNLSNYTQNNRQEARQTIIRRSRQKSNDAQLETHYNNLELNSNRNLANNSYMNHNQITNTYQIEKQETPVNRKVQVEIMPGSTKVSQRNKSQPLVYNVNPEVNPSSNQAYTNVNDKLPYGNRKTPTQGDHVTYANQRPNLSQRVDNKSIEISPSPINANNSHLNYP